MSGGSYDYLFCKETCELFNYSNIRTLEEMESRFLGLGYDDIAKDFRRLIEYIKSVMTIKEEIQIEEYKHTFAEAYKQGFIDAMSVYKTEPSFKVDEIGDDDSTIHAIAYLQKVGWLQEHDKALTEPQTDYKMPYEDCEDCETHLKAQMERRSDEQ